MGHLGLTPQSVRQIGGHKVQGKSDAEAARILDDAQALEQAGCFAVVLECVPAELAEDVTRKLRIPTVGIGAGVECDAEIQVWHDILGLSEDFLPRHSAHFAKLAPQIRHALETYMIAVQQRSEFPTAAQTFETKPTMREVLQALFEELDMAAPLACRGGDPEHSVDLLKTVAEVRAWRQGLGATSVGVVPTMGALHEGHLTLVRRALAEDGHVLVTLFVNPLQFGPSEDFSRYPRDLDSDMRMLEEAGAGALFVPDVSVMYPEGFATQVEVGEPLAARLEGGRAARSLSWCHDRRHQAPADRGCDARLFWNEGRPATARADQTRA